MEAAELLDEVGGVGSGGGFELGELVWVLGEGDDAEGDHVYHCCVAGYEEEEGDLHGVGFEEVAWDDLFGYEFADEVRFGGGEAFVD